MEERLPHLINKHFDYYNLLYLIYLKQNYDNRNLYDSISIWSNYKQFDIVIFTEIHN